MKNHAKSIGLVVVREYGKAMADQSHPRAELERILTELSDLLPSNSRDNPSTAAKEIEGRLPELVACFTQAGFEVPRDLLSEARQDITRLASARPRSFEEAAHYVRSSFDKFTMRFSSFEKQARTYQA